MDRAILPVACLLLCLGTANIAEAKSLSYTDSHKLPMFQQAKVGRCSMGMAMAIKSAMDPMCETRSDLLREMESELENSPDPPTAAQLNQLVLLATDVCSYHCAGVRYRLYTECFLHDTNMEVEVAMMINHCSTNGKIFCGLAPLYIKNRGAFANASACVHQALLPSNQCAPGCKGDFDEVIEEIGCCTNNNFGVYFTFLSNSTIEDFYLLCQISDPGYCKNPFVFHPILSLLAVVNLPTVLTLVILKLAMCGVCLCAHSCTRKRKV